MGAIAAACLISAGSIHLLQSASAQKNSVGGQSAPASDPAAHRHRIGRVQHQSCFGISEGATIGAVIPCRMETERRARSYADFVVRCSGHGVNDLLGNKAALNITFPYLLECTP